jgi:hypothetical protein
VFGVIKDIAPAELPPWRLERRRAKNIRFLDGAALQFLGHGQVYGARWRRRSTCCRRTWPARATGCMRRRASRSPPVTNASGSIVHTDITHATPRRHRQRLVGLRVRRRPGAERWRRQAADVLGPEPDAQVRRPAGLAGEHVVQGAAPVQEPDDRAERDEGGTPYPFMVKWSNLAVPGALPSTWNEADATQDAGEFDLAEGQDPIVDGLGLKDSFIVYKESSTWALDYIGGAFVLKRARCRA